MKYLKRYNESKIQVTDEKLRKELQKIGINPDTLEHYKDPIDRTKPIDYPEIVKTIKEILLDLSDEGFSNKIYYYDKSKGPYKDIPSEKFDNDSDLTSKLELEYSNDFIQIQLAKKTKFERKDIRESIIRIGDYLSLVVGNPYLNIEKYGINNKYVCIDEFVNKDWRTNLWTHYTVFLLREKPPIFWRHRVTGRDIGE